MTVNIKLTLSSTVSFFSEVCWLIEIDEIITALVIKVLFFKFIRNLSLRQDKCETRLIKQKNNSSEFLADELALRGNRLSFVA
jgi:hypothetical protein